MVSIFFYKLIKGFCKIGAWLYFNKIEINGKGNIPSDGPIIYAPNHQNAFLDAILIGIFSPRPVYFFTRGDIFKPPFLWCLNALNMLPVFRAVDGFSMAAQNEKTFDLAVNTLLSGNSLMIFPEANHDYPYILRTLSKGTARIAFATQQASDKPVYIVPVGLNYFRRHSPRFKVIINYAKPIPIHSQMGLYMEHKGKVLTNVRKEMTTMLKNEMVIPNLDKFYSHRVEILSRKNEKLSFIDLKSKADQVKNTENISRTEVPFILKFLIFLLSIPNAPVYLLSAYVTALFEDPVFEGSMKFGLSALILPLWYSSLFIAVALIWNFEISLCVIILSLLFLFIRQKVKRWTTPPESVYQSKW